MAVPTVVTVIPTSGSTIGNELIEIYGTGFRTPVVPDTLPAPKQPPTVEVYVGGVKARRVGVANDSRLLVVTPPHAEAVSGSNVAPVDILVRNIDDNGDPIAGEEVTAVGVFTYHLPNLLRITPIQFLVRWLMLQLIEQVHPEVILTEHTDWDDVPDSLSLQPVAKLPAIVLYGPSLVENRFYTSNATATRDIANTEEFVVRRESRVVDVRFSVLLLSNNVQEILNLSSDFTKWMHVNKLLAVPTDYENPDVNVTEDLELDFQAGGDFDWDGDPNAGNLRQMRGAILIRGFEMIEGPEVTKGAALGAKNSDPDVTLESPSQLTEDMPISGLPTRSPPDC